MQQLQQELEELKGEETEAEPGQQGGRGPGPGGRAGGQPDGAGGHDGAAHYQACHEPQA